MNKKSLFLLIILIFSIVPFTMNIPQVMAPPSEPPEPTDVLWYNDFNDSMAEWDEYGGGQVMNRQTSPTARRGIYSLYTHRLAGDPAPRFYRTFPYPVDNGTWTFTFYYYYLCVYEHNVFFKLGSNWNTSANSYLMMHDTDNSIKWNNGSGWYTIVTNSPKSTWHRFTLRIDTTNDDVQIWHNGNYKGSHIPSGNPQNLTYFWIEVPFEMMDHVYTDIYSFGDYEPPPDVDFEIDNMEGCGNWLWIEKTYHFEISVFFENFTEPYIFNMLWNDSSSNLVNATYDYQNDTCTFEAENSIARLHGMRGYYEDYRYRARFDIVLYKEIRDSLDIDVFVSATNLTGYELNTTKSAYFNVYNVGGINELDISEDGGRDGEAFEIWAQNGSSVRSNLTYRNFQHLHMLVGLALQDSNNDDIANGEHVTHWNEFYYDQYYGYWEFGVDYCVNDVWVEGLKLEIGIDDADTDGDNWVELDTKWWQQGEWIVPHRIELISTMYRGMDSTQDDMMIWLDIWINKENGSSVICGRVSSYWWGMKNEQSWWDFFGWFSDGWNIFTRGAEYWQTTSESTIAVSLVDGDGNPISMKDISLFKVWANVSRTNNINQMIYEIHDLEEFSVTTADPDGSIEGIITPIFEPTKTPALPSGGFLSPIFSALSGFAGLVIGGVSDVFNSIGSITTEFMDGAIFFLFRQPHVFTDFVQGVSFWVSQVGVLAGWMYDAFAGFITLMSNIALGAIQSIIGFFHLTSVYIAYPLQAIGSFLGYLGDLWNGTGMFAGVPPFKDIWLLFMIGFVGFIGIGIASFGFGWFIGLIERGMVIIRILEWLIMFGFNLLRKIIQIIMDILPF